MKKSKEFMIIGAGWGRTGTTSLKNALEIVNIKTYHMEECFKYRDAVFWTNISNANGNANRNTFDKIFEKRGFQAALDFPAVSYYKTLMKNYPDAKVILTKRDSEEWYKSCVDTIFTTMPDYPDTSIGIRIIFALHLPGMGFTQMFRKTMTEDAFHLFDGKWNKSRILKAYEEHNEEVMQDVPSDRLLVLDFSKGDGNWEKLCPFLDRSIPYGTPFPRMNDKTSFQFKIQMYSIFGFLFGGFLFGIISFLFLAIGDVFFKSIV